MSRYRRRVEKLERIVASRPPAPCPRCGTPKGWVAGFIVRDTEGNPLAAECCEVCGVETVGGRVVSPLDPNRPGHRDVLVLPAGSPPLPV